MDAKEICKRADEARADRQRLEPVYDDAIRLTMPGRKRFTPVQSETLDDVFDETGANAVQEFASRMQAGICPSWTDFVTLKANELVEQKDRRAVNKDLDEIQKYAFEEIWRSNFSQEVSEAFLDLSLSNACLLVEDGPGGLKHRALPLTDMLYEGGPMGEVAGIFRETKVKARDIPEIYPDFNDRGEVGRLVVQESDREIEIIEYTRKDLGRAGEMNRNWVAAKFGDAKDIIRYSEFNGAGTNPFIPFRWSTAAGEVWSRGPLMNALAAVRTTNLMVELLLENAAMALVGMFQTDNDGVVNADAIQLVPGAIIAKEIGTVGLERIETPTGNVHFADLLFNDQRMNIKRAMFNDMLSDPNKTPATATEVVERMADLAHRTSAGFSRVFYEFITPYMTRVLRILEERGDIELPVSDRRAISFVAASPLAQAQHSRDLQVFMQDFQIRASVFGPQVAASMFDLNELHPWLVERVGLQEKIYKPVKDVADNMKRMLEMTAQMQAAAQPPASGGGV